MVKRDLHSACPGIQIYRAARQLDREVWMRAVKLMNKAESEGKKMDGMEARRIARMEILSRKSI